MVVASLLLPVTLTGSSIAMPGVAADFHNSLAAGQWIVNAYDLTFASFMLASGSFADRFGRRRIFLIGSIGFALSSYASAICGNIALLDVTRAAAGLAAAMVLTSGSALLAQIFEGPARTKAFGVFGTAIGVGLAFGPFVAGSLSTAFGWRAIFLVPAIVSTLVVALIGFLPESSDPNATKVDWSGSLTFSGALAALIFALLQGPEFGWTAPVIVASYLSCVALLVAFVIVEQRQERPMFDLSLFKQPTFVSLCVAVVAIVLGSTPLLVYLPSYLTAVNSQSTMHAGIDLMMLTVPTVVFPLVTGYLLRWIPMRHMVTASIAFIAAGIAWLTILHPGISNWAALGPYALVGIGVGVSFGVMDGAAVSSVEPERAGMAAGMFNTMRLAGEAISIAVVGSLLVTFTRAQLDGKLDTFPGPYGHQPEALANALNQGQLDSPASTVPESSRAAFRQIAADGFTDGLHNALWVMAAFVATATVLVAAVNARHHARQKPAATAAKKTTPDLAPADVIEAGTVEDHHLIVEVPETASTVQGPRAHGE
ncbi:MFS transporter [Streptomyces sp. NBC_00483]|uniref:MFS transporter n=1 Tax=Streptomyces sp. NBC_00483 TaxID=2975756 RepID=UPI002E191B43